MDSQQQQFCLKWNSFGSNLATSFSNLFKSESLADVTLFCDGVTFRAHKLILAACSKHLSELFAATAASTPPHHNLLVILDGTSAANMAALLEFMYKGEVHVAQDSLTSFLKAAECLQVKGLSIEHEKLAVAQSQGPHQMQQQQQGGAAPDGSGGLESPTRKRLKLIKEELDTSPTPPTSTHQPQQHQSSPSPSYSPAMSPYMHPHPYGRYEQRMAPASSTGGPGSGAATPNYEGAGGVKRQLRSPSELMQESIRASVLRDGKQQQGAPPLSPGAAASGQQPGQGAPLGYRSSNLPNQPGSDDASETRFDPDPATALICPESKKIDRCQDPGCPEDLRMKMDPSSIQQDESPSSTGCMGVGGGGGGGPMNTSNGSLPTTTNFNEREQEILTATNLWNTVGGKPYHKTGTVNTPDGKKLKCPFCERLYGYETNLRAHIRQRHQGIRVPCPFCSRTFTRNNTVRRHIAREHKHEMSLKAFQQQQAAGGGATAQGPPPPGPPPQAIQP
ncbi:unnamed protein product [Acanthoscelides obtectus]|nr:unnamed protein product [Acanthoscelides obtectus]CAK1666927.1 Zinc finger protein chinmo [Acanthoscelides obtectus]